MKSYTLYALGVFSCIVFANTQLAAHNVPREILFTKLGESEKVTYEPVTIHGTGTASSISCTSTNNSVATWDASTSYSDSFGRIYITYKAVGYGTATLNCKYMWKFMKSEMKLPSMMVSVVPASHN